ncbi:MAG TPA: M1 family metallopeptidase [Clostridia bacterium]|nr:M1 family metallopeptidase [Clostridia bacterium]
MYKKICIVLVLVLTLSCFAACGGDYIDKASQSLNKYLIQLSFDEESQTLSGVETFVFTNDTENTFDTLKFHIFANAYRQDAPLPIVSQNQKVKAYVNGYSYGEINFDKISVDGIDAAYSISGEDLDILEVPLNETLYPGQTVEVEMIFEIKLANIKHRLGYGDNTVNIGNFFPILCMISNGEFLTDSYCCNGDPFVSEAANFEVGLILPENYVVGGSGELIATEQISGGVKKTFAAKCVRDFALIMSKNFSSIENTIGKTTLTYLYFDDENYEKNVTVCTQAFEYFNNLFGAYPYSTLTVAQADFCFGGMEYPRFVMVSAEQESEDYEWSIVHEIAHQWLYGLVGNDQYREAWMDEGLTEFVTLMFFDAHSEYGYDMQTEIATMMKSYTTYVDVLSSYLKTFDTTMQKPLNEFVSEQEYVYAAYVKGCLMFYDLYDTMGEARFKKALANYIDTNKLEIASPQDMIDSFSLVYGVDLTSWFEAYLTGKDILSQVK